MLILILLPRYFINSCVQFLFYPHVPKNINTKPNENLKNNKEIYDKIT